MNNTFAIKKKEMRPFTFFFTDYAYETSLLDSFMSGLARLFCMVLIKEIA